MKGNRFSISSLWSLIKFFSSMLSICGRRIAAARWFNFVWFLNLATLSVFRQYRVDGRFFYLTQHPQWARAFSFTRFLYHTQRRTTVGRSPFDEGSARRRDLYLTTHNTHNRQTSPATSSPLVPNIRPSGLFSNTLHLHAFFFE
jgi:hypothetical protein